MINLSISNNNLTRISNLSFCNLFSLKNLNLSRNAISFIEFNSFQNLNKLLMLDLNYNELKSLDAFQFVGLSSLNDLYLISNHNSIQLNDNSFKRLYLIGSIYMNESIIVSNKCIFMISMDREIQRNISNKYIFYKSINLITHGINQFNDSSNGIDSKCTFTFNMLQFKIHYNLKSDYENEIFYETCKEFLIKKLNNYNHTHGKCFKEYSILEEAVLEGSSYMNVFVKIISNIFYLMTMFLLSLYLSPIFTQ